MNALARYFFGEFGTSRAYLLSKALLIMLALDMWSLMIGHAGRYGIDGFNVAHFAWLDALQPLPSAGSYIAVLMLSGLLALVLAFTQLRRGPALALFLLYTFSWSMSMLDSYQHHYFVSLILLCMAFFPGVRGRDVQPSSAQPAASNAGRPDRTELYGWLYVGCLVVSVAAYATIDAHGHTWVAFSCFAAAVALATWFYSPVSRPTHTSGFGYPLLGASIAIVYGFTALAKIDPNWMGGHTMLRISSAEEVFAPLADLGMQLGLAREDVWSWLSTLVIPQEFALGGAYLIATAQDRSTSRWPRLLSALGFALAVVLHVGAEAMALQIGWFSYYMLLLAGCYLLPLPVVDRLATIFSWPERALDHLRARASWPGTADTLVTAALTAVCCGWLALVASGLDLPGATAACLIAGGALLVLQIAHALGARVPHPREFAAATAAAAACLWLAIAQSPVRWDFYRYLGGDLKRRGELAAALSAYERGEQYAPAGESRAKQIRELRRKLSAPAQRNARDADSPRGESSDESSGGSSE